MTTSSCLAPSTRTATTRMAEYVKEEEKEERQCGGRPQPPQLQQLPVQPPSSTPFFDDEAATAISVLEKSLSPHSPTDSPILLLPNQHEPQAQPQPPQQTTPPQPSRRQQQSFVKRMIRRRFSMGCSVVSSFKGCENNNDNDDDNAQERGTEAQLQPIHRTRSNHNHYDHNNYAPSQASTTSMRHHQNHYHHHHPHMKIARRNSAPLIVRSPFLLRRKSGTTVASLDTTVTTTPPPATSRTDENVPTLQQSHQAPNRSSILSSSSSSYNPSLSVAKKKLNDKSQVPHSPNRFKASTSPRIRRRFSLGYGGLGGGRSSHVEEDDLFSTSSSPPLSIMTHSSIMPRRGSNTASLPPPKDKPSQPQHEVRHYHSSQVHNNKNSNNKAPRRSSLASGKKTTETTRTASTRRASLPAAGLPTTPTGSCRTVSPRSSCVTSKTTTTTRRASMPAGGRGRGGASSSSTTGSYDSQQQQQEQQHLPHYRRAVEYLKRQQEIILRQEWSREYDRKRQEETIRKRQERKTLRRGSTGSMTSMDSRDWESCDGGGTVSSSGAPGISSSSSSSMGGGNSVTTTTTVMRGEEDEVIVHHQPCTPKRRRRRRSTGTIDQDGDSLFLTEQEEDGGNKDFSTEIVRPFVSRRGSLTGTTATTTTGGGSSSSGGGSMYPMLYSPQSSRHPPGRRASISGGYCQKLQPVSETTTHNKVLESQRLKSQQELCHLTPTTSSDSNQSRDIHLPRRGSTGGTQINWILGGRNEEEEEKQEIKETEDMDDNDSMALQNYKKSTPSQLGAPRRRGSMASISNVVNQTTCLDLLEGRDGDTTTSSTIVGNHNIMVQPSSSTKTATPRASVIPSSLSLSFLSRRGSTDGTNQLSRRGSTGGTNQFSRRGSTGGTNQLLIQQDKDLTARRCVQKSPHRKGITKGQFHHSQSLPAPEQEDSIETVQSTFKQEQQQPCIQRQQPRRRATIMPGGGTGNVHPFHHLNLFDQLPWEDVDTDIMMANYPEIYFKETINRVHNNNNPLPIDDDPLSPKVDEHQHPLQPEKVLVENPQHNDKSTDKDDEEETETETETETDEMRIFT